MTRPRDYRLPGIDRAITRRDFLNGVAMAIGAATAAPAAFALQDDPPYPPALTGLRGSHPGSSESAHRLRDGGFSRFPEVDLSEEYDAAHRAVQDLLRARGMI